MEKLIWVYLDIDNSPLLVGKLWTRVRKKIESASFEYNQNWLQNPNFFAIEPLLAQGGGSYHTDKKIFASLSDSAPDRWGRALMRRAERQRAAAAKELPRTLMEIDYLLQVNDEARMGALRFAEKLGGPFLADKNDTSIPPLLDLPKLLTASQHINDDSGSYEDLRLLLAPGSSLGGARPKASVRDLDGHLMIAKFPLVQDEIDVVRWEAVALMLAKMCGITVPDFKINIVNELPVLLSKRFDRKKTARIPFLSAMSMLNANDNEAGSYLDLADAIRQYGSYPEKDLKQLWRRMLFNVLISNTDDHLRNHAFLYDRDRGWHLSPAYDLNPVPLDVKPRILSTYIDFHDGTGTIEHVLSVASYFDLDKDEANVIVHDLQHVLSNWKLEAEKFGIKKREIERMDSAFSLVKD